jgi:thiamine biosynthesis lipoprotein
MLERTQVVMGTFATVELPKEQGRALQEIFSILKTVENSLSSYDPKADIYRLNHERQTVLSAYSSEALQLSSRYYRESNGYFDITVGSVTKELYRFGEEERVAQSDELQKAAIDFNGLHFDAKRAWLDEGVTVDLGGMGKGYGVDQAAAYLRSEEISRGKIALSGDIRCLDSCEMAVQDPFGEGAAATFTTRHPNTAVSTSGNYRRYVGDKSNNHLIDPKAKRPQQAFASITLVSLGSNSDIDAYATAASVMPREKAVAFLKRHDVGYLLITTSGERIVSDNIKRFVSDLHLYESAAPLP